MSKFTVTHEIDDTQISHILTSGIGHGIAYWAEIEVAEFDGDYGDCVLLGKRLAVKDDEGVVHELDRAAVARALALMPSVAPRHFADLLAEDTDTTTGDVLVQLAVFGEVVYG